GLTGDPDAGIPSADGLPIIKEIDDFATAFPPKHKKDHVPASLPESLQRAIRCFILACAGRRARGQGNKHNSMLVHVTRFVNVQERVVELVRQELNGLKKRIEFGDGERKPGIRSELQDLWDSEFVPTSSAMGDAAGMQVTWQEVDRQLHD